MKKIKFLIILAIFALGCSQNTFEQKLVKVNYFQDLPACTLGINNTSAIVSSENDSGYICTGGNWIEFNL